MLTFDRIEVFGSDEMPVSGNDGLMAMSIALAAGKSLEENRPVLLAEIIDLKAVC